MIRTTSLSVLLLLAVSSPALATEELAPAEISSVVITEAGVLVDFAAAP